MLSQRALYIVGQRQEKFLGLFVILKQGIEILSGIVGVFVFQIGSLQSGKITVSENCPF